MNSGKTIVLSSLADFYLLWTNPRNFSTQFGKQCMLGTRLIYCDEAREDDINEAKLMCGGHESQADRKLQTARAFKYPPLIMSCNEDVFGKLANGDPNNVFASRVKTFPVKELPERDRLPPTSAFQPYAWKKLFEELNIWPEYEQPDGN